MVGQSGFRKGVFRRPLGEAGGAKPNVSSALDIATPYGEAGNRLVQYCKYQLPDNGDRHHPSSENNNERLGQTVTLIRPNAFTWARQYEAWVQKYGPLALFVKPVTGTYKEYTVREQELSMADLQADLPPEILAQLFGLPQEEIEGKTLEELIPGIPSPAESDLLGKNSIPSLDPYILALGVDTKFRLPYLYVVGAGEESGDLVRPKSEYSFKPRSDGDYLSTTGLKQVDPLDIALVFNTVVPSKDLILRLLDTTNPNSQGFRNLLVETGNEADPLIKAAVEVREKYADEWKLAYKK